MKKKLFSLLCLFITTCSIQAQTLRLPNFFSDNMVVQRNTHVKFWGWGKAGQKVTLVPSWSKDSVHTTITGDATWKAELPSPEAGGPFNIEILSQKQKITLKNILVGEVWLVSGQSNMQWSAEQNLKQMKDILPSIANDKIRLLQISNIASQSEQENIFDSWQLCDSSSAGSFSAIGYFFGKKLHDELNIPIGIINSSWGGSSAEYWTPSEVVYADKELTELADLQKVAPRKPYQPGVLWNSMLYPFAGFPIAGALWYQGEDNTISYQGYDKLIHGMVNSWRKSWNLEFPFYFVQIAPFQYKYDKPNAALLREQQSKTALSLNKSGMVVVTDLVDDIKNIHPQKKKEVALRLADLALVNDYGVKKNDYQSPIYKDYKIEGNKIRIRFNNLNGKLKVEGSDITEIYIAGQDQKFYPGKGKIEGNELIVSSDQVKKPIAVRFGFSNTAMPNLFNENRLPVAPFRTDDWSF
ncbi:sialate O-acetylesterase [Sphingobacterium kyonggiense]